MNPTQQIQVRDMPYRIRGGFGTLGEESNDELIEAGAVVSEVGPGRFIKLPQIDQRIYTFQLRQHRKYRIPGHVFGKMHVGDAYSAFMAIPFNLPAVGSSITLNPVVTYEQSKLIELYKFIHADAVWIIVIPSPLGVGTLLKVYAPEIDITTETKGVRFRSQKITTIAFELPWSNDLTMIPTNQGRIGQSGLSISIQMIEDNTTTSVGTPLEAVAYCCVRNLNVSGLRETNDSPVTINGLNFTPAIIPPPPPPPENIELRMDTETNADATNNVTVDATESSAASELAPVVEQQAPEATGPKPGASKGKNQTGNLNTIWIDWLPVTFNPTNIGEWVFLSFNPHTFTKKGEAFNLPWRRNVWTSGERTKGYVTTVAFKWVLQRSVYISGIVEVQDSRNKSSRTIMFYGDTKEIQIIPRNFAIVPNTPVRYKNNPWLRTNEATVDFRYRLMAQNRGADVAELTSTIAVRPGGSVFQLPTKPRQRVNVNTWMSEEIDELTETIELHADVDEEDHIAPTAGCILEYGETNETSGYDEDLDQRGFPIEIFRGEVEIGTPIVLPINLSVITDLSGDGTNNVITQIFERFAHVQPTEGGQAGPTIGEYTIMSRLGTQTTANIAHVYLPNDVNDETALFFFDLANILGFATSALQGLGGPLLSGAIQAGRNILGPILSNLLGGKSSEKNAGDTANNLSIGGDVSLSRFINFLKPIIQNEVSDPTFGSLLMLIRDVFDSSGARLVGTIPVSVFLKMNDFQVERAGWNRTIVPLDTMVPQIYIPKDRISYIIDEFNGNRLSFIEDTRQNIYFRKLLKLVKSKDFTNVTSISLAEVVEETPLPQEEFEAILARRSLY